jgi:AP-2 complex subunit mu-1
VTGCINFKCLLSGMPECRFGLNDTIPLTDTKRDKKKSVEVDDVTFHSCVRINGKTERGISFIPPDGEFELMRYRTSKGIKTPFLVSPLIRNIGSTRIEAKVVVKSMFSETFTAGNFCLILPVPQNCAKVGLITTKGKAKYKAESNAIVWRYCYYVLIYFFQKLPFLV